MKWWHMNLSTGECHELPPFKPALAWPEPSPHTVHQTTYGTSDMPHNHYAEQADRAFVEAYLSRRCSELEAERDQAQADVLKLNNELKSIVQAAEYERGLLHKRVNELADARARIRELAAENTKLHGEINALAQMRDPPGSFVVRSPGVYVVEADPERGPGVNLRVTKHLHRDTVVLTARPGEEPDDWWQTYRDGITGNLTAWKPPKYLHDLIAHTAKHAQDPSERPWMGMDPGKPGDDLTAAVTAAAEEKTLERIKRLEQQMVAKLSEVSYPTHEMARRVDRLEAWARQFDGVRLERRVPLYGADGLSQPGYTLVRQDIKPLDRMEPKA